MVFGSFYAVNPALRPVTVESILTDAVVDLGAKGFDSVYGHGRIDARRAVELARDFRESADDQAPTVRITSPDDGSHLSWPTWVRVDADDNREIADVLLSIDGVLLASDPVFPYRFVAIPSRYAAGSHTVSVVAVDSAGNTSEPDEITLVFDGAADSTLPTVTITSPRNNATIDTAVSSIITLIAEASDDRQLSQYEILLDGEPIQTGTLTDPTATIVYNWDALPIPVAAGTHTLTVRVTDTSDNQATASIQVSVLK